MPKTNLKKSFTLVELMTPSFKTQAFFKRQNPNEFVKKGASCNCKRSFTLVELMTPDYQPKVGVGASCHSKKSFTLVELMIVIAILAILSAIVIFSLNPGRLFDNFRDTRRVSDINTINQAINFIET